MGNMPSKTTEEERIEKKTATSIGRKENKNKYLLSSADVCLSLEFDS